MREQYNVSVSVSVDSLRAAIQVSILVLCLWVVASCSGSSSSGVPPSSSPSLPELCSVITTDGGDITKVRAVFVCIRNGERVLATYRGEVIILRWGRNDNDDKGVETFWMEARRLSTGGVPMLFQISHGETVKIAEVQGFSITFVGDQLDVAGRYVIREK